MADASVHVLLNVRFADIIGIEKYSGVHYGASADGTVDRNHSAGRGGAIPALGEIRNCHINVGTGKELTIRRLASLVKDAVGFDGEIRFDACSTARNPTAPCASSSTSPSSTPSDGHTRWRSSRA